jgi:peptidyl-prolyl cis-trans isomerase B (cyclophilin B)
MALVGVGLAGLFAVVIVPAALGAISDAIYRDSYNSFFDYQAADVQFGFASFVFGILPSILMVAAVIMLPARPQATFVAAMLAAAPIVLQLLTLVASLTELWGLRIVLDFIGLLVPATAVAAWMVARMRPRAAFGLLPIALLPILLSFLSGFGFGLGFSGLGYGYGYGYGFGFSPIYLLFQLIGIGILVGIAWLARLVAQRRATGPTPAERAAAFEAQQHAARVEHLRQWEAAYSAAHGGEKPPPGTIPPLNTYGSSAVAAPTGATNTMAILALVFGIGGGWLGILFGHMALSQIRRTGEQGRGLALAGLICGYIGAGITLIVIIVLIVVSVNTRSYYYY